jgi:3-hydroxy acid dehydrogenase/malonic semialdehyde reductase
MFKTALITGATAGFGKAVAQKFSDNGYQVIITGRRCERLEELKKELPGNVLALCFDVRSRKEVETALGSLPEEWRNIDVLVNNAGLAAGLAPIQEGLVEDWEQMIDTNIKGLLYVTRVIAPRMAERGAGHIINIGSIAGKEVYPNGNVYCGTKSAVDAITHGMRMDLVKYGVKVTLIAPGAAETEFSLVRFKWDETAAANVYKGYDPMVAEDIAEVVFYVTTLPPHVNINDLVITPTAQASAMVFHKEL